MGLADLHIHSAHSDGMATVPQIMAYVEGKTELNVVAIADHDQIRGALEAVDWCAGRPHNRLHAVVGTEISASWGRHVLAFFFREPYPTVPFPRFRSLERTIGLVHDAGGFVVIPHPLSPLVPSVGERAIRPLLARRDPALAGVELCSGVIGSKLTERKARRLNQTVWRLASMGNSDAHHLAQLGSAYTRFPGTTVDDLLDAIRQQTTLACWGNEARVPLSSHLRQGWRSLVIKPLREARAVLLNSH
jgi:predicted metal-dependent phosphoesterase TrpH